MNSDSNLGEEQSAALIRNILFASASMISKRRNLFPEDCFEQKRFAGTKLYLLKENEAEVDEYFIDSVRIVRWLNKVVFPSIETGTLQTIVFNIHPEEGDNSSENSGVVDNDSVVEGFKFQFKLPTIDNWDSSKAESGAMSFLRTLSIFLSLLPVPARETGLELRRTIYVETDEHKDNYNDIATLETAYHKFSVSARKGLGEPGSIPSNPEQLESEEFLISATGGGSSSLIFPTSKSSDENSHYIVSDPRGEPEVAFDDTDEPVAVVTYSGNKRRLAAEARRLNEDILQDSNRTQRV
ncbi:hypothetical protein NDN08_006246 [Rhodosorus marinus]|uniref:HORMA domain-containing protein n=1 Tax=Rhodosorus marinus TaxID=101924 RepID=A0AAV8UK60_9RHOD|nr:hypothetical protein NDN08_006246 [Rhodosorus marinus]